MGDLSLNSLRGKETTSDGLISGMRELCKAAQFARTSDRDRWQYAVGIKGLLRCGLTESELRWLICEGLVKHAVEHKHPQNGMRTFEAVDALRLRKRSCFVLTEQGEQFALLRLQESPASLSNERAQVQIRPRWIPDDQTLSVLGRIVKRFRWPAANQETVLTAFEEECWKSIDDPLPPTANVDSMSRLRDTIKSLNRNQKQHLIQFRGDGSGKGVCWEYTEEARTLLQQESVSGWHFQEWRSD